MIQFTVPYYRRLTTHHGWDKASKHDYSVVRFHFASVSDGRLRRLVTGPPVAEVTVPRGVTEDVEFDRTVELEVADEVRAAREWARQSTELSELASHVSMNASVQGFRLDSGLAAKWQQEFTERIRSKKVARRRLRRSAASGCA